MLAAMVLALYAPFTVPTYNQGLPAMPDSIQIETCDPFVSNCNLDSSWSMRTTMPIGNKNACQGPPFTSKVPAGDICCVMPATTRREEQLFCAPTIANKNLLVRRRPCRTGSDTIIRCSKKPDGTDQWAQEEVCVCTSRLNGGCPCDRLPAQGTCQYP